MSIGYNSSIDYDKIIEKHSARLKSYLNNDEYKQVDKIIEDYMSFDCTDDGVIFEEIPKEHYPSVKMEILQDIVNNNIIENDYGKGEYSYHIDIEQSKEDYFYCRFMEIINDFLPYQSLYDLNLLIPHITLRRVTF